MSPAVVRQLRAVMSPEVPAVELGQRTIQGYYPRSQVGRVAADGSSLDIVRSDFAMASAWIDPACELRQCIRPQPARMVPTMVRRCAVHGVRPLPAEDPYPLEGEEWRAAEVNAWRLLAPSHGVPLRYWDASLAGEQCPALDAARAYCDPDSDDWVSETLILQGRPGCGKTYAMRAIQRHLVIQARRYEGGQADVRFFDFTALGNALRDPDARPDALEACTEVGDLLVDDFGVGYVRSDNFVMAMLEEIFIARHMSYLPTIISTNLDPARFAKLIGPRVFDRIAGEGAWIDVDAPSFRRRRSAL